MNYQMTIWRVALCLLLSLSFLSQPVFASEETSPSSFEEVVVASDNPIMIIRCRRSFEDEFASSTSKKIKNGKEGDNPCGFGFKLNDIGGCIPDCNGFIESPYPFEYNAETGICECQIAGHKENTSKVDISDCSFCFFDYIGGAGLKGSSPSKGIDDCPIMVCPDDAPYIGHPLSWIYDDVSEACYTACFDGELLVDVPEIGCGNENQYGHIQIEVCFTSADPSRPLVDGQNVPFEDIQNCFGDDGEVLLDLAGTPTDDGQSFYFDDAIVENGKLCVEFFVDPLNPVIINLSTSPTVVIPTCFGDPCGCENPNIIVGGLVVRFYEQLTNLQGLGMNSKVRLKTNNNPQGFTDAAGNPIADGTELANIVGGNFEYIFYRASGAKADVVLEVLDDMDRVVTTQNFVSAKDCKTVDCPVIPTVGQWGLMILALLLSSLGLLFMARKRIA